MFDLVADVEKYPQFVPLCSALKVRSRADKGETTVVVAAMTVAYKLIHQTFTSRVTLDKPKLEDVYLAQGGRRRARLVQGSGARISNQD